MSVYIVVCTRVCRCLNRRQRADYHVSKSRPLCRHQTSGPLPSLLDARSRDCRHRVGLDAQLRHHGAAGGDASAAGVRSASRWRNPHLLPRTLVVEESATGWWSWLSRRYDRWLIVAVDEGMMRGWSSVWQMLSQEMVRQSGHSGGMTGWWQLSSGSGTIG